MSLELMLIVSTRTEMRLDSLLKSRIPNSQVGCSEQSGELFRAIGRVVRNSWMSYSE